jgi:hypothetical protein
MDAQGPRETHLVETTWEKLSNKVVDPLAEKALKSGVQKWRHAETDNFIIHYRRVTEAQKVAREIEYDLWFVANTLGATKEQYAKKSHVFVFQNESEWHQFLAECNEPTWVGSFAMRDELFLHVGGMGEEFDSQTLAHETTHAVVARLYPHKVWPYWLGEGFAEYEGSASVAARKGVWIKRYQRELDGAELSFDELTGMVQYPSDRAKVVQLYRTSEKLVRFIMTEFPKERFVKFVEQVLNGAPLQQAVLNVYGDRVPDFATFKVRYDKFQK